MATVVGIDNAKVLRTTCRNCASIIEYTPSETREVKTTDYTGCTDIEDRLTCPKCGDDITV